MGKVSKKRFDVIKRKVQDTKNNNLQARPNRGRFITFNEPNKLFYGTEYSKITYEEVLKRIENIRNDIKRFDNLNHVTQNQVKVLNTLFMVNEIFTGKLKTLE